MLQHPRTILLLLVTSLPVLLGSCGDSSGRSAPLEAESCMTCHNGSGHDDYSGPGLENPHPFEGASDLKCSTCHGGNPLGRNATLAHVPPPPEIGDREQWKTDRLAYFNRLTLTGIDKFPDYEVNGNTYSAIDYLQFINPGDLRVVTESRSCGMCHAPHVNTVANSLLATEGGVLSGAMYAAGIENAVPENQGLYQDTAADLAFRAVHNPNFSFEPSNIGAVARLLEFPVYSAFGANGPQDIHNNPDYNSANLPLDQRSDGSVRANSQLANLYHEQVAFTCGDCHLGSAGANNRYGDFRSSGCTSCHMPYSLDGRSTTGDPNVNREEPLDPDDIDEPELSHPKRHLILNVAKTLPTGETVPGISDYACAGCHQGSNRTVMQFWGIRLDQNQDVRNQVQYPANPVSYRTTSGDTRLFDPEVGNRTFNGRNRNQYLLFEDYDGDERDDTPADVHYDAGMGCIDCHGSYDLHGGDTTTMESSIHSRMEQELAISCESCHGTADSYATTQPGTTYSNQTADVAVDSKGNPIRHVQRDANGDFYMTSRLTGKRHYVSQTRDVVVDSGKVNPFTGQPIYTAKGSYAMGRDDGDPATGIGPKQSECAANGFSHSDSMTCVSCHASWTNSCIGCHLEGEYNTNNNNFSNITGERIVFRERNADFVYQSPVPFQIGVGPDNKISPISPNTETFFRYRDRNREFSKTFAFSDRNGGGNNKTETPFPSLSHNAMMPHSIRGRVDSQNEGPRYCVSCHLTDEGLDNFGDEYDTLRTALASNDFSSINFPLLQEHIGKNTGNQLNSPLWVHQAAGLGSGLFLFDENGCPVNPLDEDEDRVGCDGVAPADNFDLNRVAFNLDRIVDSTGQSTGSNNHPMLDSARGPLLRDGARYPNKSGPLGASLIQRLTDPTTGIVLDSWIDADGAPKGNASQHIGQSQQAATAEETPAEDERDRDGENGTPGNQDAVLPEAQRTRRESRPDTP